MLLNPSLLVLCVLATLLCLLLLQWVLSHAAELGLEQLNFEGKTLVGSLGAAPAASAVAVQLSAAILFRESARTFLAAAIIGSVSGALGLLDDRLGSRSVGGFRGHFRELFRRRLTTGAVKALLLPPAALAVSAAVLQQSWIACLLTGALVCLGANSINLLDVRPGRAITAWLAAAGLVVAGGAAGQQEIPPLVLAIGPAAAYLPLDAGRQGMLGDTGANFLGAILGFQVALSCPIIIQAAVLAFLCYLQLLSEQRSLSDCISSNARLSWLDAPSRWYSAG